MPEISGNAVNGLGETDARMTSPFFWHAPEEQTHGDLQAKVLEYLYRPAEGSDRPPYSHTDRGPDAIPIAQDRIEKPANEWTSLIKAFALSHDADLVGITSMKDDYLYEGFSVREKTLILVGVGHYYERMNTAPATDKDISSADEVGVQYARGARAVHELRNFILWQGHAATAYPGPRADALNMIPAALDCGFGELGKHGSIINRTYGSSFRLAALATDMPLLGDSADFLGVDDFCTKCQVCENACPPNAIYSDKQMVRGKEKWYVDFDKCIPFFAEAWGCGACIVKCPWSRPGVADKMVTKLTRKRERRN